MKGKTIAMALLAVLFASAAATFLHGQATAPLLDTTTNVIGAVVSRDKVENLPLKGRNASVFLELTPGVRLHRSTLNQPVVESHWQFFSI